MVTSTRAWLKSQRPMVLILQGIGEVLGRSSQLLFLFIFHFPRPPFCDVVQAVFLRLSVQYSSGRDNIFP
jgi:hypothetical protein